VPSGKAKGKYIKEWKVFIDTLMIKIEWALGANELAAPNF
jgi:hypothetical protein